MNRDERVAEESRFLLSSADYDALVQALDNPPGPGPKLRALLGARPPVLSQRGETP
ncbi:type II toxin-antitoxin system TacA family antitoxin [Sphingosinicella sp.]|uniref:type II toxin-antitoxin system TacA family antitoxin n=1 Tax=Sphingosinicella sp. TaxID=1917971 RepID=UPI0040382563